MADIKFPMDTTRVAPAGTKVLVADPFGVIRHILPEDITGAPGKDGESFKVEASGLLAGRSAYDSQPVGFSFLATNTSELYIRQGAGWSGAILFGKGADGASGQKGWSPVLGYAQRGSDKVVIISNFVGGDGDKPITEIGKYIGLSGYVSDINDAIALPKGPNGLTGATGETGPVGAPGAPGPTGADGGIEAFQGFINPSTAGITPTLPIAFLAEKGTYANYGGVIVTGDIGYIVWDGFSWGVVNVDIALSDYVKQDELSESVAHNHSHFFPTEDRFRIIANGATIAYQDGPNGIIIGVGGTGQGSYFVKAFTDIFAVRTALGKSLKLFLSVAVDEIENISYGVEGFSFIGATQNFFPKKIVRNEKIGIVRYIDTVFTIDKDAEGIEFAIFLNNSVGLSDTKSVYLHAFDLKYITESVSDELIVSKLTKDLGKNIKYLANEVSGEYKISASSTLITLKENRFITWPNWDMYGLVIAIKLLPKDVEEYVNGSIFKFICTIKELKNANYNVATKLLTSVYLTSATGFNFLASQTLTLIDEDDDYRIYNFSFNFPTVSNPLFQNLSFGGLTVNLLVNTHTLPVDPYTIEIYDVKYGLGEADGDVKNLLSNEIKELKKEVESIKENIEPNYYIDLPDPLVQCLPKIVNGVMQTNGYGFVINSSESELGNELAVLLDYGRYKSGQLGVIMSFTGNASNVIETKLYSEDGFFIEDLTGYLDVMNSLYRVNLDLGIYNLSRVKVVFKFTSAISNGFSFNYLRTNILGVKKSKNIDTRLNAIEGGGLPTILVSPDGSKYKLIVNNDGTLGTDNAYFTKLLVMGHSFAYHGVLPQIGWHGDWGMAASSEGNDFTHKLYNSLKTYNSDLELLPVVSLTDFEINHANPAYDLSQFDVYSDLNPDIIVIKIGENVVDATGLGDKLIALLDNHIIKGRNCRVFIASTWNTSLDTDTSVTGTNIEFKKVSDHFSTRLVMVNDSSRVNTAWDTLLPYLEDGVTQPDKGVYPTGWSSGEVTEANGRVHERVIGGHPGDVGHQKIATEFILEIKRSYSII